MRRYLSGAAYVVTVCLGAALGVPAARGTARGAVRGTGRETGREIKRQGCINNAERTRILTERMASLLESGRTVDMKTLIGQLGRRSCRVPLAPRPGARLGATRLYERHRDAVLVVGGIYKCKKCSKWHVSTASGFLISADGVMVTNYHVVNSPERRALGAMTYDGRVFPVARVLAADEAGDIAILKLDKFDAKLDAKLDARGPPYLSLAPDVPVGSPVWVISHPRTHFYTFTEGMVSGYFIETRKKQKTRRMTITADFGKGSSGAPVLDENGGVVGMVASTRAVSAEHHGEKSYAQMVLKHCIPARSIRELIVDTSEKGAAGRPPPRPLPVARGPQSPTITRKPTL